MAVLTPLEPWQISGIPCTPSQLPKIQGRFEHYSVAFGRKGGRNNTQTW